MSTGPGRGAAQPPNDGGTVVPPRTVGLSLMRGLRVSLGLGLALLGLAGCSRLPTLVPDMAVQRGPAVQLQGARGPLSAAQSQAILARLSRRGQPTDIFERHLAVEEAIVGSPLTTGNRVLLLQDGPATYRAMLAAIEGARDHINMRPTSSRTTRSANASRRR